MSKDFFLYCLERNPALLKAMLRFNRVDVPCPLPEVALPESVLAALRCLPEVRQRFAAGPDAGFWDFAEEVRRLALLEPADVRQAALTFAAAAHAQELAEEIRGPEVTSLRQHLGRELYDFALRRGRFRVGSVRELLVDRDSRLPLLQRIRLHAGWTLSACCADWPEALRQRAALCRTPPVPAGDEAMSPAAREADAILPLFTQAQQRDLWTALKNLLLVEVAPQWAPYFD